MRELIAPLEEGRHLRWTVNQRNILTRILCDPTMQPELIRQATSENMVDDLLDPFGIRRLLVDNAY